MRARKYVITFIFFANEYWLPGARAAPLCRGIRLVLTVNAEHERPVTAFSVRFSSVSSPKAFGVHNYRQLASLDSGCSFQTIALDSQPEDGRRK
jgi:hypothetical protein